MIAVGEIYTLDNLPSELQPARHFFIEIAKGLTGVRPGSTYYSSLLKGRIYVISHKGNLLTIRFKDRIYRIKLVHRKKAEKVRTQKVSDLPPTAVKRFLRIKNLANKLEDYKYLYIATEDPKYLLQIYKLAKQIQVELAKLYSELTGKEIGEIGFLDWSKLWKDLVDKVKGGAKWVAERAADIQKSVTDTLNWVRKNVVNAFSNFVTQAQSVLGSWWAVVTTKVPNFIEEFKKWFIKCRLGSNLSPAYRAIEDRKREIRDFLISYSKLKNLRATGHLELKRREYLDKYGWLYNFLTSPVVKPILFPLIGLSERELGEIGAIPATVVVVIAIVVMIPYIIAATPVLKRLLNQILKQPEPIKAEEKPPEKVIPPEERPKEVRLPEPKKGKEKYCKNVTIRFARKDSSLYVYTNAEVTLPSPLYNYTITVLCKLYDSKGNLIGIKKLSKKYWVSWAGTSTLSEHLGWFGKFGEKEIRFVFEKVPKGLYRADIEVYFNKELQCSGSSWVRFEPKKEEEEKETFIDTATDFLTTLGLKRQHAKLLIYGLGALIILGVVYKIYKFVKE